MLPRWRQQIQSIPFFLLICWVGHPPNSACCTAQDLHLTATRLIQLLVSPVRQVPLRFDTQNDWNIWMRLFGSFWMGNLDSSWYDFVIHISIMKKNCLFWLRSQTSPKQNHSLQAWFCSHSRSILTGCKVAGWCNFWPQKIISSNQKVQEVKRPLILPKFCDATQIFHRCFLWVWWSLFG